MYHIYTKSKHYIVHVVNTRHQIDIVKLILDTDINNLRVRDGNRTRKLLLIVSETL